MATQVTQDEIAGTTLGYAQITADFSTTSQSLVDVTGLSVAVTIPAGGRRIRVTAFVGSASSSVANSGGALSIYDVTAGAQLAQFSAATNGSGDLCGFIPVATHSPTAGARTYKVQLKVGVNPATVHTNSSATNPSFILVELI